MNRWRDWLDQGARDLRHAENALDDEDYEWAAFAAQQAAEKTLKGLIMVKGGEPWGHLVTGLVEALPKDAAAPPDIMESANRLDKHYIPSRYPNGFAEGLPGKAVHARGSGGGDHRCQKDHHFLPAPLTSIKKSGSSNCAKRRCVPRSEFPRSSG